MSQLQQIYAGTRKWGTVRLQIKRSFIENFQYKKTKQLERVKDNLQKSNDVAQSFSLSVKAATPNIRISTIV